MELPYLEIYLGTVFLLFAVETWLDWRQYWKHQIHTVPKNIVKLVTAEEFVASQRYQSDKRIFTSVFRIIGLFMGLYMTFRGYPLAWSLAPGHGYWKAYWWTLIAGLMDTPLEVLESAASSFGVEAKHGFNKMTVSTFVTDLVKNQLISMVAMACILPAVLWLIDNAGDRLTVYLWGFLQTIVLGIMLIYPNVIMPLFNKFEPIDDQELQGKIESMAKELKFPLQKLHQIDGSKRSSHSNAFFYGFGKHKGIALFDTLLHLPQNEIMGILCHEFGHWVYMHLWMNVSVMSVNLLLMSALFHQVMFDPAMYTAFFFAQDRDSVIGFVMFQKVFMPASAVFTRLIFTIMRRNEAQADSFAVVKGYGESLKKGLESINKENKGSLCPDPYYAWYHFSHPGLLERLEGLDKYMAAAGKEGKKQQ